MLAAVVPIRIGRGIVRVEATDTIIRTVYAVTTPTNAANDSRVHEVRKEQAGKASASISVKRTVL